MSVLMIGLAFLCSLLSSSALADQITMTTATEQKIAAMAAKDGGYGLDDYGPDDSYNWLQELSGPDGVAMFDGYYNIAVYAVSNPPNAPTGSMDLAMNLAIRKKTADVVETNTCTVLRYPDLMKFRRDWLKKTGNKPVSLDHIQQEVNCEELKIARRAQ